MNISLNFQDVVRLSTNGTVEKDGMTITLDQRSVISKARLEPNPFQPTTATVVFTKQPEA